jgi:hypothetical protein
MLNLFDEYHDKCIEKQQAMLDWYASLPVSERPDLQTIRFWPDPQTRTPYSYRTSCSFDCEPGHTYTFISKYVTRDGSEPTPDTLIGQNVVTVTAMANPIQVGNGVNGTDRPYIWETPTTTYLGENDFIIVEPDKTLTVGWYYDGTTFVEDVTYGGEYGEIVPFNVTDQGALVWDGVSKFLTVPTESMCTITYN